MSVKIAIIGTSHVSAIVQAWQKIKSEFKPVEVTFFAAPGRNFRALKISPQKRFGILDYSLYRPDEINLLKATFGKVSIKLNEFDAVIHVGHNTKESELARLIAQFSIDGLREIPAKPRLTQHAYETLSKELAKSCVLPEGWQNWSAPKLFVVPAPRICESCIGESDPLYAAWAKLLKNAAEVPVATLFERYMAEVQSSFAHEGIQLVPPPGRVIADNGFTRERFTGHATRLTDKSEYPANDHKHMNRAYGLVVLRNVLKILAQTHDIK